MIRTCVSLSPNLKLFLSFTFSVWIEKQWNTRGKGFPEGQPLKEYYLATWKKESGKEEAVSMWGTDQRTQASGRNWHDLRYPHWTPDHQAEWVQIALTSPLFGFIFLNTADCPLKGIPIVTKSLLSFHICFCFFSMMSKHRGPGSQRWKPNTSVFRKPLK